MKKPDAAQLLNLQAQHERGEVRMDGKPILAIDYGEKFCGVALALDGATVLPVAVIANSDLAVEIKALLAQHKIEILVVGLPISADNSENKICEKVRLVVNHWRSIWPSLTIEMVNERFSSQATLSPDSTRIDDLAAMHILQFYLDQTPKS